MTPKEFNYHRYSITVSQYFEDLQIKVEDNYWGRRDYAFIRRDLSLTSYNDVAVKFVENALKGINKEELQPGKYSILMNSPFGKEKKLIKEQ